MTLSLLNFDFDITYFAELFKISFPFLDSFLLRIEIEFLCFDARYGQAEQNHQSLQNRESLEHLVHFIKQQQRHPHICNIATLKTHRRETVISYRLVGFSLFFSRFVTLEISFFCLAYH